MPCNQVGGYKLLNPSLLYWKMEAEDLSQTLISRFQTVQCHIPVLVVTTMSMSNPKVKILGKHLMHGGQTCSAKYLTCCSNGFLF